MNKAKMIETLKKYDEMKFENQETETIIEVIKQNGPAIGIYFSITYNRTGFIPRTANMRLEKTADKLMKLKMELADAQ